MLIPCGRSAASASKSAGSPSAVRPAQAFLLLTVVVLAWQLASWARIPGTPASSSDAVQNSSSLPAGTILPVRLEDTISVKEAQQGQLIEAKIMQDVPLPDRETIPAKSIMKGSIVSVERDNEGVGSKVTVKFNQLEASKETLTIATYLRAIASFRAVRSAQIPLTGSDGGTPDGWGDTVQIGGDVRFGDGGAVRNHAKQKVGKGVRGGVLVRVRANPALGCDGPVDGDDHPQALWVFSADACGVYDLKGTKIARTGKSAPAGEITLHFEKDDAKLEAGTGILLRIVSQP
jgi:hypothetical protein